MAHGIKRHRIFLAILLVPLFSILALWGSRRAMGPHSAAIALKTGPVVESVYGLGTVTARRTYQVKLGITTSVKKVFVQEGDQVAMGQPLISFDEGQVSKAPFNGVVTLVAFKEGESVFPQAPILALTDLTERYVLVTLEQQGALRVRPSQYAQLSFESLRAEKFKGLVKAIYPSDGQFVVRIDVEGLPPAVLPGMTADVAIEVSRKAEALLLPVSSVSGGHVLRIRDGARNKVQVKIGSADGEWAEVTGGDLKAGDSVMARGN